MTFKAAKSILLLSLSYILVIFIPISCKECPTEPGPVHYQTGLAVDYAGPSFVSLYFSISDSGQSRQYAIRRDTSIILGGTLKGGDTVVTDWQAEPATSYRYQLMITKNGKTLDTSRSVTTTSMDTTSHEFTWEVDTLGENGTLFDVWAFSENNVWAVGKYKLKWGDTKIYLLASWNGEEWENKNIGWLYLDARFIYSFSPDDVWSYASWPAHWDGYEWYIFTEDNYNYIPKGIYDCWGTDSNQMYFVGREGTIVHYDGQSFTRMASPTDRDLLNIDGCVDRQSGEIRAWAGGWSYSARGSFIALRNNKWELVCDENHPFNSDSRYVDLGSLYVPNDKYVLFVIGGHSATHVMIHNQVYFKDYYKLGTGGPNFDIHGNAVNDFFIIGDNNILHYNGSSFHSFDDIAYGFRLMGVYQYIDNVFIVGTEFGSQRAIAIRGVRP